MHKFTMKEQKHITKTKIKKNLCPYIKNICSM